MSRGNSTPISPEMAAKILDPMLQLPENKECADCGARAPRWASTNLGVFICIRCSGIHRNMGTHISKVKSVSLDKWLPEQIEFIKTMGNGRAKEIYEANVPPNYPRPRESDNYAVECWIRAKYDRKEFMLRNGEAPRRKTKQDSYDERPVHSEPPRSKYNHESRSEKSHHGSSSRNSNSNSSSNGSGTNSSKTSADLEFAFFSSPSQSPAPTTTSSTQAPKQKSLSVSAPSLVSFDDTPVAPVAAPFTQTTITTSTTTTMTTSDSTSFFDMTTNSTSITSAPKPNVSKESILSMYNSPTPQQKYFMGNNQPNIGSPNNFGGMNNMGNMGGLGNMGGMNNFGGMNNMGGLGMSPNTMQQRPMQPTNQFGVQNPLAYQSPNQTPVQSPFMNAQRPMQPTNQFGVQNSVMGQQARPQGQGQQFNQFGGLGVLSPTPSSLNAPKYPQSNPQQQQSSLPSGASFFM